MSEIRDMLPLLIIGGGFAFAGSILYGAWLLGRYRGRDESVHPDVASLEARLNRVEYALGQTTHALERMEAAHSHAVRLMMEQGSAPRIPGRVITPH